MTKNKPPELTRVSRRHRRADKNIIIPQQRPMGIVSRFDSPRKQPIRSRVWPSRRDRRRVDRTAKRITQSQRPARRGTRFRNLLPKCTECQIEPVREVLDNFRIASFGLGDGAVESRLNIQKATTTKELWYEPDDCNAVIDKSCGFLGQRVGIHPALDDIYSLRRPNKALINAFLEQYSPQSVKCRIRMCSALDQFPVLRSQILAMFSEALSRAIQRICSRL